MVPLTMIVFRSYYEILKGVLEERKACFDIDIKQWLHHNTWIDYTKLQGLAVCVSSK